jgi:hypothetical protein
MDLWGHLLHLSQMIRYSILQTSHLQMADTAHTLLYTYLCINFSYVHSVQEYYFPYIFIAHKFIIYSYYSVNTDVWLLQQSLRQPVTSIHS